MVVQMDSGSVVAAILGLFGIHTGGGNPQPTIQQQMVATTQVYRCEAQLVRAGYSLTEADNTCAP